MANAGVFESGYDQGFEVGARPRLLKQGREEELRETELQQKATDLAGQRLALQTKYAATLDAEGKPTDASTEIDAALQKNAADLRDFFHPQKNPGAIQKFGHILTDALKITKPSPTDTMVVPNPQGLIGQGNIRIWGRPSVDNGDGTHSSEYSVSFKDDNGHEVLIPTIVNGKFLTPDGKKPTVGSEAEKAMFAAAWQHYLKTGENLGKFASDKDADAYANILHNRGATPKSIAKQEATRAKNTDADMASAKATEAGAPLSDLQKAVTDQVAKISSQLKVIKNNPDLSDEDKQEAIRHVFGVSTKPDMKAYVLPNKTIQYFDASRPDLIPEGATAYIPQKTADEEMNQYNDAVSKGYKGSFLQWKATQSQHPSVSPFNEGRTDYANSYGFDSFDSIPVGLKEAADNYILRKQTLDRQSSRKTTTTLIKEDALGRPIPVTVTNYVTPTGNESLIDPLEAAGYKRAGVGAPSPASSPTPQSSAKPAGSKGKSSSSSSSAVNAPTNARVGPPLNFQMATPATRDTQKTLIAAKSSYDDVYKAGAQTGNGAKIDPVGSQGIILAWLRGRVNRVTGTEINAVNNLGGVTMRLEGDIAKYVSGTMTPQQYSWFLQSAKNNRDIAQKRFDETMSQSGGTSGGTGGLPPGWTP